MTTTPTWRDGIRAGVPIAAAILPLGATFGVLARSHGWGTIVPIVFSLLCFSGSAQFAAAGVLAAGGGAVPAIVSALVINLRYVPMGLGTASAFRGGRWRRAFEAQALADASFVVGSRGDGTFERRILLGASVPQYVCWVGGTALGVLAAAQIGNPNRFGLDAIFPAFFLALLGGSIRERRARQVAVLAGVITVALIPITPPGVPIVAACLAALLAFREPPPR